MMRSMVSVLACSVLVPLFGCASVEPTDPESQQYSTIITVDATTTCGAPDAYEPPPPPPDSGCTLTIGYWKTHPEAWPVGSLTLGSQVYTQAQALALFALPVKGDSSINLAHQLMGALLNSAAGASTGAADDAIAHAQAYLSGFSGRLPYGVKSATAVSLASALESYNSGGIGPGHCD